MSELPNKMKITFGKSYQDETISLWFSNTVLKIFQNDREGFTFFEWKSFKLEIDTEYFKEIKGKYHRKGRFSDWLALCLDNYNLVEFEDFSKISDKDKATEVDDCFPPCIPESDSIWTAFILAKDLIDADLNGWIISRKANSGAAQWLISRWSKLKSSIFRIFLLWNHRYIKNISKLPPQNIELVVLINQSNLQLKIILRKFINELSPKN